MIRAAEEAAKAQKLLEVLDSLEVSSRHMDRAFTHA